MASEENVGERVDLVYGDIAEIAPHAQPLCTVVAELVDISDFASRAPRWC